MQPEEFLEAVRKNETNRINQLLRDQPSLAGAKDKSGVSAIFLALYRGNRPTALTIAANKPELDIYEASALGELDKLRKITTQDPSLINSYSADGFTALALAAYLGQKGSVEYLVEEGANVNSIAKNPTGFTPLTGAVSQNHNEIAKILVEGGAHVDHRYEGGFTPLMHASYAGNIELVTLLLNSNADPNAKNDEGKTPLSMALERANDTVAAILKKHGAK